MDNEERAHRFWVDLVPQIQMVGIDGKRTAIDALKKAFDAVRLDEAEWWARPIESVEGIWRSIEEQRERIAALREGKQP